MGLSLLYWEGKERARVLILDDPIRKFGELLLSELAREHEGKKSTIAHLVLLGLMVVRVTKVG